MDFLKRVDDKILSFFTKISHKFQRLTGRTNFFLAKCFLVIAAFSIALRVINIFIPLLSKETFPFEILFLSIWGYWITKDMNRTKTAEDNILSDERAKTFFQLGFDQTRRILFILIFLFFDFTFIVSGIAKPKTHWIFEITAGSFVLILVIASYFMAVDPLPPGKSKIKEWLESFGKVLIPIPIKSRR